MLHWNENQNLGRINAFYPWTNILRRTGIQASHDSVISTIHPRRFNPQRPIALLTAFEATDAT